MTELSFLLDLLLTHKLSPATKKVIVDRIKCVEANLARPVHQPPTLVSPMKSVAANAQAASTLAILEKHNLDPANPAEQPLHPLTIPAVPIVAQTPAAVAALNARQQAINIAASGREEKGRTSPRKF